MNNPEPNAETTFPSNGPNEENSRFNRIFRGACKANGFFLKYSRKAKELLNKKSMTAATPTDFLPKSLFETKYIKDKSAKKLKALSVFNAQSRGIPIFSKRPTNA